MEGDSQRSIFISHRHADRAVADVLRRTFESWSSGHVFIFQSSDVRNAPSIGERLTDELRNALSKGHLVLLIYTSGNQDWSYCMWECGIATGVGLSQDSGKPGTKLIVFQCTQDVPGPFHDRVRVLINEQEIKRFTVEFHKKSEFFPGFEAAFAPDISEEAIQERSTDFFNRLKEVVPEVQREEQYRWDFLRLSLSLEAASKVRKEAPRNNGEEDSPDVLLDECQVVYGFGEAAKHFGYDRIERGMKFLELVARWEADSGRSRAEPWFNNLLEEMKRAIAGRPAEPKWALFKSARAGVDWWLLPVLNHVRVLPEENLMELDLYLYRVGVKDSFPVIEIPNRRKWGFRWWSNPRHT